MSKEKIKLYVDSFWVRKNQPSWFRFIIGFNGSPDKFHEERLENNIRDTGCYVGIKSILSLNPIPVGWFLGSDPRGANTEDLEDAIMQRAESTGQPLLIECRIQQIKLTARKASNDRSPKVRAVHVYCHPNEFVKTRTFINQIYGSKHRDEGPPQGKKMKFIPYTANNNFPSSAKLLQLARTVLNKQELFLKSIQHTESTSIINLDYLIAGHGIGCTLRQAIMSMKCEDGLTQLFTAVDHKFHTVILTYPSDHETKANTAVTFLASYLEQKFGAGMWSWFTPEAKEYSKCFTWDERRQQFIQQEAENDLEGLLQDYGYEDYELLESDDEDMDDSPMHDFAIVIDIDGPMDHGTVYNRMDDSIGTMGPAIRDSTVMTTNDGQSELSSVTNSHTLTTQNEELHSEPGDPG